MTLLLLCSRSSMFSWVPIHVDKGLWGGRNRSTPKNVIVFDVNVCACLCVCVIVFYGGGGVYLLVLVYNHYNQKIACIKRYLIVFWLEEAAWRILFVVGIDHILQYVGIIIFFSFLVQFFFSFAWEAV